MSLSPDPNLRPSKENYEELGRELSFLCNRLTEASLKLAYMTGTSKQPYKLARDALRALDKCKSETEDLMFNQHPEYGSEWLKVFYGCKELPEDLEYKSIE